MINGETTESLFDYEATSRSLRVSKPNGVLPYDRIVDNGATLLRVQIKHTNRVRYKSKNRHTPVYSLKLENRYTSFTVDFICVFIPAQLIWYIIPVYQTMPQNLEIPVNYLPNTRSKMIHHRDAWHYLTTL